MSTTHAGTTPHAAPPPQANQKHAKDPDAPAPPPCPTCGQPMPDKPPHWEEYPKMMFKEQPPAPKKAKEPEPEPEPEAKIDTKVVATKEEQDKAAGEGYSDKVPERKKPPESKPVHPPEEHKK